MRQRIKILFIRPRADTRLVDWYPTLGVCYLSSYLKERLPAVTKLADENVGDDYRSLFGEFQPDAVAITSTTLEFSRAAEIAREIKEHGRTPVLIGGPHMMAIPETLPGHCDVGVFGEGEQTFVELVEVLAQRGELLPEDIEDIQGVVYRAGGSLVRNPPRRNLENLDEIPFPDRSLISERYLAPRAHFPGGYGVGTSMMTSRGCAYRCIYCESGNFWGRVRYHSPEYVVAEIEDLLRRYPGLGYINIFDDLFNFSTDRVERLAEAIEGAGLHRRVAFACQSAALLINERLLEAYRKMNIRYVGFGFETGSERIMKLIKYKAVSVAKNVRAIGLCREYGIHVGSGFMIGNPTEGEEDFRATYEFVLRYPLDAASVYVTTPLLGTPIWYEALKQGKVSANMDWRKINQFYIGDDLINLGVVGGRRFQAWRRKISYACAFSRVRASAPSVAKLFINAAKFIKWHPRGVGTLLRGMWYAFSDSWRTGVWTGAAGGRSG